MLVLVGVPACTNRTQVDEIPKAEVVGALPLYNLSCSALNATCVDTASDGLVLGLEYFVHTTSLRSLQYPCNSGEFSCYAGVAVIQYEDVLLRGLQLDTRRFVQMAGGIPGVHMWPTRPHVLVTRRALGWPCMCVHCVPFA